MHLHEEGFDGAIKDQRVPQARAVSPVGITVFEGEIPEPGVDRLVTKPPVVGRRLRLRWRCLTLA